MIQAAFCFLSPDFMTSCQLSMDDVTQTCLSTFYVRFQGYKTHYTIDKTNAIMYVILNGHSIVVIQNLMEIVYSNYLS